MPVTSWPSGTTWFAKRSTPISLAGERRALHAAAARALSGRGSAAPTYERATLLALQWDLAAEREQALPAFITAARASMGAGAWAEAQRAADRALALWPTVDDDRRRVDIAHVDLLMLSAAAAPESMTARRPSSGRKPPLPRSDPTATGSPWDPACERLGWYAYQAGSTDLSIDAGRASVQTIPRDRPLAARARALSTFANRLSTLDRDAEALPLASEALEIATAVADLPEVGRRAPRARARALLPWGVRYGPRGPAPGTGVGDLRGR